MSQNMHQLLCGKAGQLSKMAVIGYSSVIFATVSYAEENLNDALEATKFSADIRLRYENVEQSGFAEDAHAFTARARLGLETGVYKGFSFLGEIDATEHLGDKDFNSTANGRTAYPVVADPDSFRLNRANIKFTGIEDTTVKVGRQRIIHDDARFLGNVGWRQNEQTFDATRVSYSGFSKATIEYGYLWRVNRIFGSETLAGTMDSDSHFVRGKVDVTDNLSLTAYGYILDFEDMPGFSSSTFGVRASGKTPLNDAVTLSYNAAYASQSDNADNPADYDADYYQIDAALLWNGWKGQIGYEVLEGDGVNSFKTPLATGHKFQGFADVFLATPGAGVEDLSVHVMYKSSGDGVLPKGLKLGAWFHDFEGNDTSIDMGQEFDAVAVMPYGDRFTFTAKFADYDGDGFAADRQKIWLSVDFKY